MPAGDGLLNATATGVRLRLLVTPRAARSAIAGIAIDADGAPALRVRVTAAPEGGRANAAVVRLLAKAWRVPKTSIRLVAGAADRRKVIEVAGDPDEIMTGLNRWRETEFGR